MSRDIQSRSPSEAAESGRELVGGNAVRPARGTTFSGIRRPTSPLAIGVIFALQCTPAGSPPSAPTVGRWGGAHVALVLFDSGGTIEYDCAHGGLRAPVRPDRDGRFEVDGVHVREHGGPVRVGEVPDSIPARYAGQIIRNRMTLRVLLGADTLGPFDLRRDAEPQLFKCL